MTARVGAGLGVGALVGAAVVLYAASDSDLVDNVVYLGVMITSSIVAVVGAARAPGGHRLVGGLIAAGICLTTVGDTVWTVLDAMGAATDVSIADPVWFATYVVLCAALIIVLRRSGVGRQDLTFLIDAVTILVVCILVIWSTSIETIVADDGLATHVLVVWAAYPVADAVLLALVARVLTSRAARISLDTWLAAGVCLWLAADLTYLQSPEGSAEILMDAAYMVALVLMARSVWRLGTIPVAPPVPAAPASRLPHLVVAVGPLLVPPALEVIADVRGEPHQPVLLAIGATTLTLLAFVRVARLIRSEEQALRQLKIARDAALEGSRAKSMFLATMSHEIRTPLTAVLGAAEMLEDTPLDDLQLDLLRMMRRSGGRLRALTDGILDFSRIEAGQLQLASTPFVLGDVLDVLSDDCRPRAKTGDLDFECVLDPRLPHIVVGDPDRLLQILGNLVDNAVKFTHAGRVRLEIRPLAGVGDVVEFVVTDTGIGIPEEQLSSVFESFIQVDGSTTRRYGGAGLGLAICKKLAELMGGSLGVTSEVGVGSGFVARIPLPPVVAERVGDHPDVLPPMRVAERRRFPATTSG